MDYKLISALVGAGYDNTAIDKILAALPRAATSQQVQQIPQIPQAPQVPQVQQVPTIPTVTPVQQVPTVQQVPQVPQVPTVTPVQQIPQVPQVQPVPTVQQVPPADINADLSRRMLTLMRDMQTAAGFSGNLDNSSNPPKTAEDVSLDILNAGGDN